MEPIKTVKCNIDYPQEEECITSPAYTMRIKAPLNAEKVEVCIDGAPWLMCRYSAGFWWFDWTNYKSGEHEIVARILPFDSRNYALRTRRVTVSLETTPETPTKKPPFTLETNEGKFILMWHGKPLANFKERVSVERAREIVDGLNRGLE